MITSERAPIVIAGDEALASFRDGLTGPYALDLLANANGGMLVQLPVGVGKTAWMVQIISHALATRAYDLVVVLVPRWDILRELLARLPTGMQTTVLRPRPQRRCGGLNETWLQYEQQGLGHLGRATLCSSCPKLANCPWPGQYGSRLRGQRLILGTQQHLTNNPSFLLQLKQQTAATNPLVLIDESNFLIRPAERIIRYGEFQRFTEAQESHLESIEAPSSLERSWLKLCQLLPMAGSRDLREGNWRFPPVAGEWALGVQSQGVERYGEAFRFLGNELHNFSRSDRASRERLPGGDTRFASLPDLGSKFIVFTGSMAKDLARYRLDPNFTQPTLISPFDHYRFANQGTAWFNINNMAAAAMYFRANADRILDFFAAKIARNIREGKRTLLVSKKSHIPLCRRLLRRKLAELGLGNVKIVAAKWGRKDLTDPQVIALINYGMAGLNCFEHIECAYCLNSYYVPPALVSQGVQDIEASTDQFPVEIVTSGEPRRRQVKIELPDGRVPILPHVAQQVLEQLEADVVVQAVGRVRPFTRPREVITFQADALPGVEYTIEFRDMAQIRKYFQIRTPTQTATHDRRAKARRMKALGCSRREIMEELDVSLSTVKRYLKSEGGS